MSNRPAVGGVGTLFRHLFGGRADFCLSVLLPFLPFLPFLPYV